ncbi:hypothetical protein HK101_008551 [Irineochytrium annulatum]|nr:hypothetical protein HK101_008551 [Irineochytrium annulatum]
MNNRSNNPILVCLDETPRAAQTLRFVVENLMHAFGETVQVVVVVPANTYVHDSTSRLKSFLRLIMEPYHSSSAKLSLNIISSNQPAHAIADLARRTEPRLIVLGPPCPLSPDSLALLGADDARRAAVGHATSTPSRVGIANPPAASAGPFANLADTLSGLPRRMMLGGNSVQPYGALASGGGSAFSMDEKLTSEIMATVPVSVPIVMARIPTYAAA